ncbi:MAG: MFS transporter [bacterium]|nr:MFS transporter [bacterium]
MNKVMETVKNNIRTTVWRYYAFRFFQGFAFFSAVLVPFFTQWGHITLTQVQILQSWFMLWIFLLEIPTGAVADRFGRKHSLALGGVVVAGAALIYGSVPKFEVFLLAEFLFAAAMALISGADSALLYDALKEAGRENESKKIFGKAHSFNLLGILLSAPIGSFIAARYGLNAPVIASAIPFMLAALVAWTIKEPKVHGAISESKRYLEIVRNGFSFFRGHKTLRLLALDAIIVASAAYFVIWLYQPLFISLNIPIFYFGFFHALLVGSEIIIAANFVRLEKLFGSGKAYLRFTAIVTSVVFILTAAFPNFITVTLFIIIAGGFGLTRMELMSAYMNRFIPSEQRATVLSSISMFRRFVLVFLNPAIGFTADHSLRLALLTVGLLPLLVFFFSPVEQEMLEED